MPRLYCPVPLVSGLAVALPAGAARHVQVLRMQPGQALTLFNGEGGEYAAEVLRMGRSDIEVRVGGFTAVEREAPRAVHLALGMPANERMDWLVEKATELGATSFQPLMTQHSVLRLSGERAQKKQAHWQAIAAAACEQCGRNRVPEVRPVREMGDWLRDAAAWPAQRLVLSLDAAAVAVGAQVDGPVLVLSGPEGGLSAAEEQAVRALGFAPVSLGPRVLRAETAPLAVVARLAG